MKLKARSPIAAVIYETIENLHTSGTVDKSTLRDFASRCLVPDIPSYGPEEIRALRERVNVSQGVFASLLNASTGTVQQWEQGLKRPGGIARKLLSVIDRKGIEVLM